MKWLSLLFACLLSTAVCADDVIRESANGSINWSEGVIYAQGFERPEKACPKLRGSF